MECGRHCSNTIKVLLTSLLSTRHNEWRGRERERSVDGTVLTEYDLRNFTFYHKAKLLKQIVSMNVILLVTEETSPKMSLLRLFTSIRTG